MEETCSVRQLWVAAFVALLAPISALPVLLARAGALGWLGPVAALPVLLVWIWRLGKLGGAGLTAELRRRWGWLGKGLLTLYYIWAMALAALTAGSCVDRLSRTDYLTTPNWVLALALTAVAAYLIYKGPDAFLRAVEIFFLILMAAVILLFALGAANLRWENVAPAHRGEAAGIFKGILPTLATAAAGTLVAFLPHRPRRAGEGRAWRWVIGWTVTAAGLCLLVIGALGAPLTAQAPLPFFLALQGLGFPGGFQRLEALGTAAWLLSDLVLLGLAALAGANIAGRRPWACAPPLLAALVGGCFLPNAQVASATGALLGVNLALGVAIPLVLSFFPARRNKG